MITKYKKMKSDQRKLKTLGPERVMCHRCSHEHHHHQPGSSKQQPEQNVYSDIILPMNIGLKQEILKFLSRSFTFDAAPSVEVHHRILAQIIDMTNHLAMWMTKPSKTKTDCNFKPRAVNKPLTALHTVIPMQQSVTKLLQCWINVILVLLIQSFM